MTTGRERTGGAGPGCEPAPPAHRDRPRSSGPAGPSLHDGTSSLTGSQSDIAVNPSSPVALAIATPPSSTATAGKAFATQPVIEELDAYGNIETGDSTHTVAAASTGTASLQGNTTITLAGGVASFSGLSDNKAETITIQFTTNAGRFSVTSGNFAVSPAATSLFVVTGFPSPVTSGGRRSSPGEEVGRVRAMSGS